jgi:hypothetical protein
MAVAEWIKKRAPKCAFAMEFGLLVLFSRLRVRLVPVHRNASKFRRCLFFFF